MTWSFKASHINANQHLSRSLGANACDKSGFAERAIPKVSNPVEAMLLYTSTHKNYSIEAVFWPMVVNYAKITTQIPQNGYVTCRYHFR